MRHQDEVEVHAEGVVGDRYSSQSGTWSLHAGSGRALTLIEEEAIEAVRRDYGIDLAPGATRRNVVTRGVALNHLVGRTFHVGEVEVVGVRLGAPWMTLKPTPPQPITATDAPSCTGVASEARWCPVDGCG